MFYFNQMSCCAFNSFIQRADIDDVNLLSKTSTQPVIQNRPHPDLV